MKIVHIIDSISTVNGGPSRSVQGLVAALGKFGDEVWLFSCTPGERPSLEGIDHFAAPPKCGLMNLYRFLVERIGEIKPELIHIHAIWDISIHIAAKVARKFKIPYILAPRGSFEPWAMQHKGLKKKLAMFLYQRSDLRRACALHATAEKELCHLRELGFENRIFVIQNGVNFPGFIPEKFKCSNKRRILFLGRMCKNKGIFELVAAWEKIKPVGWECELVYTCRNEEERTCEQEVKAKVKDAGFENDFIFTGQLDDEQKWAAYRRADLFVLPTYSENFGIVIAEAMYAEVPVITTKGAPWDILERERCGKWIEVGVEPLIIAMKEMMALDEKSLLAMGARGRQVVLDNFAWGAISQNLLREYHKLLS